MVACRWAVCPSGDDVRPGVPEILGTTTPGATTLGITTLW